uniref:Uncharacterized protein n=1 Tax=Setaria viridis TaxID=4556 RepID=A0A4U6TNA6_SETVI|nr:hypothetical protein SEVIR_7G017705v2 [Setaria viridis]TKW03342.1 hypothetical protein SEVIR_7G017705v2 [Setaria viridis]TKW03343.1 hypothetical protein SEVIR_7G017705v2 [Setaria viridis]
MMDSTTLMKGVMKLLLQPACLLVKNCYSITEGWVIFPKESLVPCSGLLLVPMTVIGEGCCCRHHRSHHQDVVEMETLIDQKATVLEQVVLEMTVLSFDEMVTAGDLRGAVLSFEEVPSCRG